MGSTVGESIGTYVSGGLRLRASICSIWLIISNSRGGLEILQFALLFACLFGGVFVAGQLIWDKRSYLMSKYFSRTTHQFPIIIGLQRSIAN